ncbi:MAG: hypothetical protein P8L85_24160 [Rubripirellula sp.]|nr:hypothetical protein [Rubripirellula sp.]
MNLQPGNPYSPPTTTSSPSSHQATKRTILLPVSLVALFTIAYLTFSIICLSSGGVDQQAGMMLILNAPMLLLWIGLLIRPSSFSTFFGYTAVGVQGLILLGMLIRDIGDPTTVFLINGIMIVSEGLIAGTCHWVHRRPNRNLTT